MNLRKKLTVASILMIMIPLAVSALLCVVVVFYRGNSSLNRLKSLYENDNGYLDVQTILYSYEEQILSYTPPGTDGSAGEGAEGQDSAGHGSAKKAFGKLIKELEMMRYYYQIRYGSQVVASNLPEYAGEAIAVLAGPEYMTIRNFAVTDGEDSVVKRTYSDGIKTLDVIAYCDQYDSNSHLSQVVRDFVSLVFLFMGVLTVTVVASIVVLTKWLSTGMARSLGQLSEAVRQVQDGNLSYRIKSQEKDELGKACQEFDEMAEYLENSVKEREMYEEARKQMLAGISHDLRTPLTSVKAYVEGLRDGIANTEEKRQRYYDALKIRTADLEALIDNLSLFSGFDRGEYGYTMERIELGQFLLHFFGENAVELQENHVTLHSNIPKEEGLYISGDRVQLRRLLANLLDNTLKYREKEETVLKVSLYGSGGKVILEMEDDGPGVPKEERERIFDTFYRGDKARSNPGSGSGLGLSIVKKILKKHGAVICAKEGSEGKGLKLVMEFSKEG